MGKVVEKKRKKKGRPSLLDLQKRNLKQQQEQQQALRHKRENSAPGLSRGHDPAGPRRSTRRNPIPDGCSPGKTDEEEEEDEDGEFSGRRREKKLKLVLKLPAAGQEGSPTGAGATGPAESSAEEEGEEEKDGSGGNQRKRKIREIGDVSGAADGEKVANFHCFAASEGTGF